MSTTEPVDTLETTSAYPEYNEYEDSGVEWLGEIPTHWGVERLKWTVTDCKNGYWGDSPEGSESDIDTVRVADFDRFALRVPDQDFTVRSVPPEKRSGRVLEQGDLLLEKSGGGDKQPVGVVVLYDLDQPAVSSNFIARMPVADGHDSSFLRYLHGALYEAGLNERAIKQSIGIQNLDADQYLNQEVGLPPLDEQRAIATFLDRETGRIDALIEKKEELIDLLEEKRTALISRVVTKGLDPDVEMQDSGVEWLGKIPAHWKTVRLKHLATAPEDGIQMGPYGSMLKGLESRDTGYKVYGQENIISGEFKAGHRWLSEERFHEMADRYELQPEDLVLTRKGSIGNSRIVPKGIQSGIIDSDTIRLRLRWEKIDRHFLQWLLHEAWYMQTKIALVQRGAVLSGLNTNTIENLIVALPPTDEQEQLVKYLNSEAGRLDEQISTMKEGIDRLKEYRTALISAAVTGQIDVRGEAGTAPAEQTLSE